MDNQVMRRVALAELTDLVELAAMAARVHKMGLADKMVKVGTLTKVDLAVIRKVSLVVRAIKAGLAAKVDLVDRVDLAIDQTILGRIQSVNR